MSYIKLNSGIYYLIIKVDLVRTPWHGNNTI